MFFSKFFRKDPNHFVEQGERCLAEERYAEARIAFEQAQERLASRGDDGAELRSLVSERITLTRNKLALLNLAEAEHAHARGDDGKAEDHLVLVEELAEDVGIREKAAKLLELLAKKRVEPVVQSSHSGCAGCAAPVDHTSENTHVTDDGLSDADRFDILIHTLPADLPRRYADLGEKFACAYLLGHDGAENESIKIYEELLSQGENDIVLYEAALMTYKLGRKAEAERMLRRAMELNPENPLPHLGVVQLLSDCEKFREAIEILDDMIERKLLPEHSTLLRGDLYQCLNEMESAVDSYSQALTFPSTARPAAEKLVSLLEHEGRSDEAQFLFKKYLKGCC